MSLVVSHSTFRKNAVLVSSGFWTTWSRIWRF